MLFKSFFSDQTGRFAGRRLDRNLKPETLTPDSQSYDLRRRAAGAKPGQVTDRKDMKDFRYLTGVSTLLLDRDACIGCGVCELVCPHGVLGLENGEAAILDFDGCMECGACARNCSARAIRVTPGVGCAAYIIQSWLQKIGPGRRAKTRCC